MSQEAITEIDMDVFSRRIGPYFSWLESRIESGWQQSDSVSKDVLKEAKYLATTMRARFILGVSKDDFAKEVKRALELFELAADAFPSEGDEVDTKTKHFCKGVSEELGAQFLPAEYREPRPPQPPEPHPFPQPEPFPEPEPEPMPGPEPLEPPDEEKIRKVMPAKPKVEVKKPIATPEIKKVEVEIKKQIAKQKKIETPQIKKTETKAKPVKAKTTNPARKSKKSFFLVRWAKNFIYGED